MQTFLKGPLYYLSVCPPSSTVTAVVGKGGIAGKVLKFTQVIHNECLQTIRDKVMALILTYLSTSTAMLTVSVPSGLTRTYWWDMRCRCIPGATSSSGPQCSEWIYVSSCPGYPVGLLI